MKLKFTLLFLILIVVLSSGFYILSELPIVQKQKCYYPTNSGKEICRDNSSFTRVSELNTWTIDVVLISEDINFYHHRGFDWYEMKESFLKNFERLSWARGGSTISQQTVKNLYLQPQKTLVRKIREAYLTYKLESIFSKPEILELYFNIVEFGPHVYGVRSAALFYFQKLPGQLNLAESAFIAHLLPNPIRYAQGIIDGKLTEFNRARIKDILDKLLFFKKISNEQHFESLIELEELDHHN